MIENSKKSKRAYVRPEVATLDTLVQSTLGVDGPYLEFLDSAVWTKD